MNISDSPGITLAPNTIGITVHFGEHGMALLHKIGQVLTTDLTKDLKFNSVHDKFHRTLILSGFCFLKIAKISLNSSFFPKPIKR